MYVGWFHASESIATFDVFLFNFDEYVTKHRIIVVLFFN